MGPVQRWTYTANGSLQPSEDGEFVAFAAYDAIKQQLEALEAQRCKTCAFSLTLLKSYHRPDKLECLLRAGQWVPLNHGCRDWNEKEEE